MRKERNPVDAYFLSDNSDSSKKVKKLLTESQISFKEIKSQNNDSNGLRPLTLVSKQGEFFGLEEIQDFIETITNRPRIS